MLIPVLRWTGRRNRLLNSFGRVKQQFDAPRVVLFGSLVLDKAPRKFIMILNLLTNEIEKLKILSFIEK